VYSNYDTCVKYNTVSRYLDTIGGQRLGETTSTEMIVKPLDIKINKADGGDVSLATKEVVVQFVSEHGSIRKAAKCTGVDERTIRKWQADDGQFRMELAGALTSIKEIANDTLLGILEDPESTKRDKIQATKVLAQINGHMVQRSEQVNVNIAGGMHELKEALALRNRGLNAG